eukprot:7706003-Pyramimonas_sp.AAC.1
MGWVGVADTLNGIRIRARTQGEGGAFFGVPPPLGSWREPPLEAIPPDPLEDTGVRGGVSGLHPGRFSSDGSALGVAMLQWLHGEPNPYSQQLFITNTLIAR